jgi:hypothetical protein
MGVFLAVDDTGAEAPAEDVAFPFPAAVDALGVHAVQTLHAG